MLSLLYGPTCNPLQYSCLENSKDREAWWATIHGVTKSQMQLSANTSRKEKSCYWEKGICTLLFHCIALVWWSCPVHAHSIAASWHLPLAVTGHLNCCLLVVECLAGHNMYVISLTLLSKQSLVSIGMFDTASKRENLDSSWDCLASSPVLFPMMLPIISAPSLVQKQGRNDHVGIHAWFVPFRLTLFSVSSFANFRRYFHTILKKSLKSIHLFDCTRS